MGAVSRETFFVRVVLLADIVCTVNSKYECVTARYEAVSSLKQGDCFGKNTLAMTYLNIIAVMFVNSIAKHRSKIKNFVQVMNEVILKEKVCTFWPGGNILEGWAVLE